MPFNRPTLSELRQRNQSYIQSELKTGGNLLRFSNIGVISDADAGMAHLHYGYLDYIVRQATPIMLPTSIWRLGGAERCVPQSGQSRHQ